MSVILGVLLCSKAVFAEQVDANNIENPGSSHSSQINLPSTFYLSDHTFDRNVIKAGSLYQANDLAFPHTYNDVATWLKDKQQINEPNHFGDKVWFVVKLKNVSEFDSFAVSPYNSLLADIQFRILSEDDLTASQQTIQTGEKYPTVYDYHYGGQATLIPDKQYYLIGLLQSDYFYGPIKLSIKPTHAFKLQIKIENLIIALCLGIALALMLYNLLVFIGSKDITHLYYALFIFLMNLSGVFFFHMPMELAGGYYPNMHWVGFNLAMTANAMFYISFLQLKSHSPKLYKLSSSIALLALISTPLVYLYPAFGFLWVTIISAIGLTIALGIGVRSWHQGYRPAKYFVFAYLAVMLPNMFLNISNMPNVGILPPVNINVYLIGLIGTTLDSILLAFAMADRLSLLIEENKELNENLEGKVELRTRKLNEITNQLQEASAAKSRFVANMSHEIRTPLTSIIGYAEGIIEGDIPKEQHKSAIKTIAKNGDHLLALVSDVLDISKIEENKLTIETMDVDLIDSIEQIKAVVSQQLLDKRLFYRVQYEYPLPSYIQTDPTRLRQVLLNLLNNAIKFTEEGGVTLTISYLKDTLTIQVTDTGIGISQEQQKNIFAAFKQADSSTTRRFGGTGLGLNISQSIARKLGGKINVTSALDFGSEFTVTIKAPTVTGTHWINSFESLMKTPCFASLPPAEHLPSLTGTVLLAEDHPDSQDIVELFLKHMGLNVVCVGNGEEALEAVMRYEFDLILLDIQMPVMDGVQALNMILATGEDAPVIALTANAMSHEVNHYIEQGFTDHLSKPIDRELFTAKISHYLNLEKAPDITLSQEQEIKVKENFMASLIKTKQNLIDALERNDWHQIAKISHGIKGSATMFGYQELSEISAELELATRNNNQLSPSIATQLTKALLEKLTQAT